MERLRETNAGDKDRHKKIKKEIGRYTKRQRQEIGRDTVGQWENRARPRQRTWRNKETQGEGRY